jgi:hypothetical protein
MMSELELQEQTCLRLGVSCFPNSPDLKVGMSQFTRGIVSPLNGLRHPPTGDTSGWYIWRGGEPSEEADFFMAIHAAHLTDLCPEAIPYLGLPPGWRFLIAEGYEDVWFDASLLDVS